MKKKSYFNKCLILTGVYIFTFILLCSCSSTKQAEKTACNKNSGVNTDQKNLLVNLSESPDSDDIKKRASLSAEKQFKERIAGIDFSIKSLPKQTTKNTPFPSAYIIKVTDASGNPVPDFSVTISCPSSRTNDAITYESVSACTSADGSITFIPGVPKFSFDDKITFYPTPVSSDPIIMQSAFTAGVSAPYKVITDYARTAGVIYVFDFNEDGKPGTNSQYLLRELINSGVRIGNSPISTSVYLSKPVESLYKATYDIVGNVYSFMICGTIKYVSPVEKNEDGKYVCQLVADIRCIDMKNGSVVYTTQQTATALSESKYKVADDCRQLLAAKTAHAVLYGM
jgi:hypothetical protein